MDYKEFYSQEYRSNFYDAIIKTEFKNCSVCEKNKQVKFLTNPASSFLKKQTADPICRECYLNECKKTIRIHENRKKNKVFLIIELFNLSTFLINEFAYVFLGIFSYRDISKSFDSIDNNDESYSKYFKK